MKKILVIDDNVDITDIIKRCLAGRYDIVTENSGEKALELIRTTGFDLIILDVIMPDIDGIEMLAYMQKAKITTPVLVMSGHPIGERFFKAATILGAVQTLHKPFTMEELILAVEKALGK